MLLQSIVCQNSCLCISKIITKFILEKLRSTVVYVCIYLKQVSSASCYVSSRFSKSVTIVNKLPQIQRNLATRLGQYERWLSVTASDSGTGTIARFYTYSLQQFLKQRIYTSINRPKLCCNPPK